MSNYKETIVRGLIVQRIYKKLLIDCSMSKYQLKDVVSISSASITNLAKKKTL